jgi:ferric-dicitrate binding protein FerR (iron transport regulator)
MKKEYILHKWMNEEASSSEIEQLKSCPEYASYMEIALASKELDVPNSNSEYNFIQITKKVKTNKKVRSLFPSPIFLKIAALVTVLFAGYLYVENLDTTIKSQIAEKRNLYLPGNSEVVMNSNSIIKYNESKWNETRTLELDGEAYFKVTKGSTFEVKTNAGTVKVLGTAFNVFAREKLFYVSCYEGLVSVTLNDTLIMLPAGDDLMIENGAIQMHKTNTTLEAPDWTKNESSFKNIQIGLVLEELKRQYPITLTTKYDDTEQRFTGSFSHNDLNLALKSICNPLHLEFIIEEERVTIYAKESN